LEVIVAMVTKFVSPNSVPVIERMKGFVKLVVIVPLAKVPY